MSREAIQELWPHEGTFCYGCGKNNEHGLQLKSFWENEETVATWKPMDHHMAFRGILNGGIIATIIDCHGTGTANAHVHKSKGSDDSHFIYVTSGLSVRFLRPTPIDKPVTLRARVKDISGRKITVTCSLYSGETKCATGEVVTVRVDQEEFLS
jgi:acyl-coenzyme A thioesterase PaaI-like protein